MRGAIPPSSNVECYFSALSFNSYGFLEKMHEASNNVLIYFDWCFLKHPKNVVANFLGRRIENRMNFLGYSNLFGESPV